MVRSMSVPCPKCGGRLVSLPASFRAPAHDSCRSCGNYLEHPCVVVKPGIPPVVQVVGGRGVSPLQLEKDRERQRLNREKKRELLRAARGMA